MRERARRALLDDAIRRLESVGIENARKNAEWLLCETLSCSRAGLYADINEAVGPEAVVRFRQMLERRVAHEPLQYILGFTEFFGLRLEVTPAVLIPRPETEELVEEALKSISSLDDPRVLDVGTGSGCIALAVKSRAPGATVFACDVSEAAIEVARRNAALNDLTISFFQSDVLSEDFETRAPAELDLFVSNPPYIAEDEAASLPDDVRAYEPHLALFSREDPIAFYRRLAEAGLRLLKDERRLVVECHAERARDVADSFQEFGYQQIEVLRDLSGRERIVIGRKA